MSEHGDATGATARDDGHGQAHASHGGHGSHGQHASHGGHSHGAHSHGGHGHAHLPSRFGRAFAIGIALNLGFVLVEAVYGVIGNSMALLADAGHNLSDVLGLVVAWVAAMLSKRLPTPRYTYGLRGSSILAALFNAVVLLVAVGAIAWESVQRLFAPEPVAEGTVMAVAAVGILVNGVTAWLFAGGRKGDLNIRGAYLHMVADAAVSAGVVVAAFVVKLSGWAWLDPLVSLVIVAVIAWSTWDLLRASLALSLAGVPEHVDPGAVRGFLGGLPGVSSLHDLHIWAMSTSEVALTAHLVMPGGHPGDGFLVQTAAELDRRFGIAHATLQIEVEEGNQCALAPDEVV